MLRLEYLLLISKVTLLALGKLREDFDCSDGVAYEGFCFYACPSSFLNTVAAASHWQEHQYLTLIRQK